MVHVLLEARRAAPSILYLPHAGLWWATAPPSLRTTLQMVLADLGAELPVALLGSCDEPWADLDEEVRCRIQQHLHLPHAGLWWATAPPSLRTTLQMVLAGLGAELPVALLGSCDEPWTELDQGVSVRGSGFRMAPWLRPVSALPGACSPAQKACITGSCLQARCAVTASCTSAQICQGPDSGGPC